MVGQGRRLRVCEGEGPFISDRDVWNQTDSSGSETTGGFSAPANNLDYSNDLGKLANGL